MKTVEHSQLLHPFDFSDLDVLELGPSRNVISKYLAEQSRSLTFLRADQLKLDPDDAAHPTIDPKEHFDVVCLIGTLDELSSREHASRYLTKAATYLKPGGALIVAVHNRLGLRYWNGEAEPFSGLLFEGISGYPASGQGYSRRELLQSLRELKLTAIDEYYAFPDYRAASAVLSLRMIESFPLLAADVAETEWAQPAHQSRYFSEHLALRSVARAGILPELASSFLFVAAREAESRVTAKLLQAFRKKGEVGWYYSLNRRLPSETIFRLRSGDELASPQLWIEKRARVKATSAESPLIEGGTKLSGDHVVVSWNPGQASPAAGGEKLRTRLLKQAYSGEWKLFRSELESFLNWSFSRWERDRGFLSGRALDALFTNTIGGSGSFELFGLEWVLEESMPRHWFVFRNLRALQPDLDAFGGEIPFRSLDELYQQLCERFSIRPELEDAIRLEAELQSLITRGVPRTDHLRNLEQLFSQKLGGALLPRDPEIEARLRTLRGRFPMTKIAPKLRGIYQSVKRLGRS